MYYMVEAKYWHVSNRGTANEFKSTVGTEQTSGPFETRESAEAFARGLACCQPDLASVKIREREGP